MSKIYKKLNFDLNKQLLNRLLLVAGLMDNSTTTKLLAVMPSRHSLAIFMPKICEPTKPTITTGIKQRHIYFLLRLFRSETSYDGFIDLIKDLYGNKSSRLVTVVTTRHHFCVAKILTKLLGGHNHA